MRLNEKLYLSPFIGWTQVRTRKRARDPEQA